MPTFVHIQANGTNLPGRSAISEIAGLDLQGHTQIASFYQDTTMPGSQSSGITSTRVQSSAYTFVKTLDGISPLLLQALTQNQTINANFRFFDVGPDGAAREAHRITLLQGRITGLRMEMQHLDGNSNSLPLERVSIIAHTVTTESFLLNTEFTWDWTEKRMSISRRYFCQGAILRNRSRQLTYGWVCSTRSHEHPVSSKILHRVFLTFLDCNARVFHLTRPSMFHQWAPQTDCRWFSMLIKAARYCAIKSPCTSSTQPISLWGMPKKQIRLHLGEVVCEEVVQQLYWLGAAG